MAGLLPTAPALLTLGLCLGCTATAPAGGTAPGCTAAALQEIVWEQDCPGCPQGLRLRFGRDGRALLTATGKARLRTADEEHPAALPPAEFDRLAAELAAAGLLALAPLHEEPGLADGRWTQWVLRCAGGTHEVFRREAAGPPALDTLDAIALAWRRRLWPAVR